MQMIYSEPLLHISLLEWFPMAHIPTQSASFHWGKFNPSNTWFFELTKLHNSNGILTWFTVVTNRNTHTHARTHARTHTRTHACTHTLTCTVCKSAAYCYRCSMFCLSACLLDTNMRVVLNGWTSRDAILGVDSGGPEKHILGGVPMALEEAATL